MSLWENGNASKEDIKSKYFVADPSKQQAEPLSTKSTILDLMQTVGKELSELHDEIIELRQINKATIRNSLTKIEEANSNTATPEDCSLIETLATEQLIIIRSCHNLLKQWKELCAL